MIEKKARQLNGRTPDMCSQANTITVDLLDSENMKKPKKYVGIIIISFRTHKILNMLVNEHLY